MDDQLKTFIEVANDQSFNKAASVLFISTPAVIKQINALEDRIKVKLFDRTHNGVTLTKSGKSFYQDALKLLAAYNQSIDRAQTVSNQKKVIKIGAGPLATGAQTSNIWAEIGKKHPELTFDFIPCACALGDYNEFLSGIGEVFDLVSSVYDKQVLKKYHLQALELNTTPLKLSVPITNPLSKKDNLTLNDLDNQTVALPKKGKFDCFDKARTFLEQNSNIHIKTIPGFDMNIINQCVSNNWILCSTEDWQTVHPLLESKNIDWNCTAPYGIIYNDKSSVVTQKLIESLKKH